MKHPLALVLIVLFCAPAIAQQALQVPSGQPVTLGEVLIDDSSGEVWVRFRFLAPQVGDGAGLMAYQASSGDMDFLCNQLVLPYLAQYALEPARVVISFSQRALPFGATDPEITQYFDAYRPESSGCVLEAF